MSFFQEPHQLANTFDNDPDLRAHLQRLFTAEELESIAPQLRELGSLASDRMLELAREAENNPPRLVQYGAYGRRIDHIETSRAWSELHDICCEFGIMATPYEGKHGPRSRVHQFALLVLYAPSSAFVSCPYAMTDGAIATLKRYGDSWADDAIARLMSRDPAHAWTSGQWMTEKEGGSDVGRSSTIARKDSDGTWRLYGTKYFTSATTADCTLTLARPEGARAGSGGLSMFYLEPWHADGTLKEIKVRRLKDKLGTKALPTAELELEGVEAIPVGELEGGLRKITTVLNIARYHNTTGAVSTIARAVQLATDYATRRQAFGAKLIDLPLHAETLAELHVDYAAAMAIGVRLAELLGKVESGEATDQETGAWRLLTPLAKLGTAKQAVAVASETLEAFGGAGYMEDTGLPVLLRDAQVLPIWEGTTNVLSLDALRAMAREAAFVPFLTDLRQLTASATAHSLTALKTSTEQSADVLGSYAKELSTRPTEDVQADARHFALSLYNTYAAALLLAHAQWEIDNNGVSRTQIAATRWIDRGLVRLGHTDSARRERTRVLLGHTE